MARLFCYISDIYQEANATLDKTLQTATHFIPSASNPHILVPKRHHEPSATFVHTVQAVLVNSCPWAKCHYTFRYWEYDSVKSDNLLS